MEKPPELDKKEIQERYEDREKQQRVHNKFRAIKKTVFGLGTISYIVASCFYGPLDTFRVAYSLFNPAVKEADFRTARSLFAKSLNRTKLGRGDEEALFRELGVVGTTTYTPQISDIKYSILLDFIEDMKKKPKYQYQPWRVRYKDGLSKNN